MNPILLTVHPPFSSSSLRTTLRDFSPHVAVYGETLDLSRFAGPDQEDTLRTYLQAKYRGIQFGVLAAVGPSAFALMKRWRSELWPGVPIVFAAIDEATAAGFKLEPDMTGVVMHRTVTSMLGAARILVPDLKGVAVLGGSLERDAYRREYVNELTQLTAKIEVTDLTGKPLAEQIKAASALPNNSVILYTSLFVDDAGTTYSSPDALAAIAKVANRPIIVDVKSLVGTGAAGGFVLDNASYGSEVASLAMRIVDGAPVADIPVRISDFTTPVFDWRQLQRWGIDESTLPKGSEIAFRVPTAWDQYRWHLIAGISALLGQSLLIAALLYQSHRRRQAESEARHRMTELARMNRHALAGEMSGSIAHELNQPLSAILSNAQTARALVNRRDLNTEAILEILADIIADDKRAAEVIKRVRKLVGNNESKPEVIDLNQLMESTLRLLHGEFVKRQTVVETTLATGLPRISGDPVQLQQVLLNLLLNAIDAVSGKSSRIIRVSTRAVGTQVEANIVDFGHGITAQDQKRLFEPFFTTKENGLGLGLSICSTIVTAHGGKLSIQNNNVGGATAVLSLSAHNSLVAA